MLVPSICFCLQILLENCKFLMLGSIDCLNQRLLLCCPLMFCFLLLTRQIYVDKDRMEQLFFLFKTLATIHQSEKSQCKTIHFSVRHLLLFSLHSLNSVLALLCLGGGGEQKGRGGTKCVLFRHCNRFAGMRRE